MSTAAAPTLGKSKKYLKRTNAPPQKKSRAFKQKTRDHPNGYYTKPGA